MYVSETDMKLMLDAFLVVVFIIFMFFRGTDFCGYACPIF